MQNERSSRGRRESTWEWMGRISALRSSRPGPCSCGGWVASAHRKAPYVSSVLLLGACSDSWPLPSAVFHSVGFRKLTICCMALKLTLYKLGIIYKKIKVKLLKETFCPLEVETCSYFSAEVGLALISRTKASALDASLPLHICLMIYTD